MEVTPLRSYRQKRPVLSPFPPPYKPKSPEHIQIQTEIKIDRRGLRKKGQLASRGWRPTGSSGVFPARSLLFTQPPLCLGAGVPAPCSTSQEAPSIWQQGLHLHVVASSPAGPAQTRGACVSNGHRGDIPDTTACLCPASSPKKDDWFLQVFPNLHPCSTDVLASPAPCHGPRTPACPTPYPRLRQRGLCSRTSFTTLPTAMPDLSTCESKQRSRNF